MDIILLINRCLRGNDDAWQTLVDIILPIVISQCNRFGLSSEETNDIFGEVSYKILKGLGNLKEKEKFPGYVKTIAKNEIYHLRRDDKTHDKILKLIKETRPADQANNPEEIFIKKQLEELVSKAHDMMPERCKKLLKMVFSGDDDFSLAQIAKKLGRQESSVRESVYRCMSKLKAILKKLTNDENLLY